MSRLLTLPLISLLVLFASMSGCLASPEGQAVSVFHAGSLAGPFSDLEERFESEWADFDIRREAAGSAATIRKVTELNRPADVVASADYTLIESMMMEGTQPAAEWYIQFAANSMVIAYTDKSSHRNEVNESNWPEILMREGVKFGFSNPNDDPCGYRTLMTIQLAGIINNDSTLFERLIEDNTAIASSESGGHYTISMPESTGLSPNGEKVMVRSAEVDLLGPLEIGEIDYLFIYRSVAYQHRDSGVEFIPLSPQIDLSDADHAEDYGKVSVELASETTVTGKPIVYGVTIPTNAENPDAGLLFLEMLLGEGGREILTQAGQIPIYPATASDRAMIPKSLLEYVE